MADYTWLELLRRLGLEARPHSGYIDTLAQDVLKSKYGINDDWYRVNKYDTDFNRPIKSRPQVKVSIPNRELMIADGKFSMQPEFLKNYILNRANVIRDYNPQQLVNFMKKNNMRPYFGGWVKEPGMPTEYYRVPLNNISRYSKFRFPSETLGMIGEKFMATPGVKPTLNFLGRASIPLAIYEGLNSPLSDEEEVMNNYNAVRGLPLQGGIKYYGE